jgi:hypothetical protein
MEIWGKATQEINILHRCEPEKQNSNSSTERSQIMK